MELSGGGSILVFVRWGIIWGKLMGKKMWGDGFGFKGINRLMLLVW